MKTEKEIQEMLVEVMEQREAATKGTPVRRITNERVTTLAWVLGHPDVQKSLVLNKATIDLLDCLY